MELGRSDWSFDGKVVPVFDEHVSQSVPLYDEIHSLISEISAWFLSDHTNMYDIGTSTGKVIRSMIEQYPTKQVQYIGIDSSKSMCEEAVKNFQLESNVSILNLDVTKDLALKNASLITSVLTMQFIQEKDRQKVIDSIYKGLNKGSAFIMVEKIVGSNARFNDIWTSLYHELKLKNGLSEEHVMDKSRSIRGVMNPYTVNENIEMLYQAGFKDVDTFFKWNNFAGFIAIK